MSRLYDPSSDYRNYWQLGQIIEFDGPSGIRLTGRIVRVSSNPSYLHVDVNGRRYEVDIRDDKAEIIWG